MFTVRLCLVCFLLVDCVMKGYFGLAIFSKTRLKKFSPRPRGKSVIGKILFEYMIKFAKLLFKKVCVE